MHDERPISTRLHGSRMYFAPFPCPLIVLLLLCVGGSGASGKEPTAPELLRKVGFRGGLVVHVGCGNGHFTSACRVGPNVVVHGLGTNPDGLEDARAHAASRGLSGAVSFSAYNGSRLPFVPGLVDVLIVSAGRPLPLTEAARVLAPRGVLLSADPLKGVGERPELEAAPSAVEGWSMARRKVPNGIDEWTHFLHGPDGHVMSRDTIVAPPHHVQWIGEPTHARSHVHLTTVNVMVTAGGRLFYIADISPTALPEDIPSRWALIARNAFNGITLWQRPLETWQPYYVKDRNSYPADLHRRLVATGDAVFVTLSILGPVAALDPVTGETVRTYPDTEKTEDIVFEDGVLYLSVNTASPDDIDRRGMAYRHIEPTQKRVMAVDAGNGHLLWSKEDRDTEALLPMSLAAKGDRLYLQNAREVVCLDKATGRALWRSERPSEYRRPGWSSPTLTVLDDVVISADRQGGPQQKVRKDQYAAGGFSTGDLVAFDVKTGERLWSAPCAEGCRAPTDVFSVDDRLWFGKALERSVQEYCQTHDVRSGQVLKETPPDPRWPRQHHHRCYRDKATVNYILSGRTGIEFIELATGNVKTHNWLRGNCKFGILPANGLITMPPEQCGCYIESKLTGFHALAPRRSREPPAPPNHTLVKGPAFGTVPESGATTRDGDWPTYRHDAARTGATPRALEGLPHGERWAVRLGGMLTPPVVAKGQLLVAQTEAYALHALGAENGDRRWTFQAGGRIDSPPTISRGIAVFGCRDGWVYALRCSDGALVWRFRGAPYADLLTASGRVESVWPIHGSVLVDGETVMFASGRSSYVDGGLWLHKLDLATGRPLLSRTFCSRDPETGDTIKLYEPYPAGKRLARMEMPGVLPDVLSTDGKRIWMRSVTLDSEFTIQSEFPPHLFCSMGFLDASWWELTYWLYGEHMFSGRAGIAHAIGLFPTGRIMACGENHVYAYQYGYERIRKPRFIASGKTPKRKTIKLKRGTRSQLAYNWTASVPVHVQGLVLAGNSLFMAGPPEVAIKEAREALRKAKTDAFRPEGVLREVTETFLGQRGGKLVALDKTTGEIKHNIDLEVIPVFDGLITAEGRLFMSAADGSVRCLE